MVQADNYKISREKRRRNRINIKAVVVAYWGGGEEVITDLKHHLQNKPEELKPLFLPILIMIKYCNFDYNYNLSHSS